MAAVSGSVRLAAAAALAVAGAAAALAGASAPAGARLVHAGVTGASGATAGTGATGATGASGSTGVAAAGPTLSANWAGYAAVGTGAVVRHFTRIRGGWVAPAVACAAGTATYSAFWVGLGGYASTAAHLEQIGTEADCDSRGAPHYFAWYELVPRGSVTLGLVVHPGDALSAVVAAGAGAVTFTLTDATTGARFHRRIAFAHADTTSAEWIAEAPSSCGASRCRTLPLGDFGTVTFSGAAVRTHSGLRGSIAGAGWSAVPIELRQRARAAVGGPVGVGAGPAAGAIPSVLAGVGSSFAVSFEGPVAPPR